MNLCMHLSSVFDTSDAPHNHSYLYKHNDRCILLGFSLLLHFIFVLKQKAVICSKAFIAVYRKYKPMSLQ